MILPLSLSVCWKMVTNVSHNQEVKMQLLSICSIVSSWASQSWHLEGPRTPLFLILSQFKISLWCTNRMKSLIFIHPWCLHRFCQILSGTWESSLRRIPFASLRLKVPSLLLPHLSWSCPPVTKIFLCSTIFMSASTFDFAGLSSLQSIFLQTIHFPVCWVWSQKSFTLFNPWVSVSCLRPKKSSFNRIGSCCHLSSQNRARSPSLISQKLYPCTRLLFSQALF